MNIYESSIINFGDRTSMPINFISKLPDETFNIVFDIKKTYTYNNEFANQLLTIYAYEFDTICIKYFIFLTNESGSTDVYELNEHIYMSLMPSCYNIWTWYIYTRYDKIMALYDVSDRQRVYLLLNDGIALRPYIMLFKPIVLTSFAELRERLSSIDMPAILANLIESHIFIEHLC